VSIRDHLWLYDAMRLVKLLPGLLPLWLMPGIVVRAGDSPPLPFVEGSWTIVLLPDTQRYPQDFPETFCNQTRWIAENKLRRRIAFVLHEGDIVNQDTASQWANARRAINLLDGQVPYVLAAGNRDYSVRVTPGAARATWACWSFSPTARPSSSRPTQPRWTST
jgi:hypothetical protein